MFRQFCQKVDFREASLVSRHNRAMALTSRDLLSFREQSFSWRSRIRWLWLFSLRIRRESIERGSPGRSWNRALAVRKFSRSKLIHRARIPPVISGELNSVVTNPALRSAHVPSSLLTVPSMKFCLFVKTTCCAPRGVTLTEQPNVALVIIQI